MLKYQAEGKCLTQSLKPTLWYISLSSCDSVGQSYYAKSEIFSFLENSLTDSGVIQNRDKK